MEKIQKNLADQFREIRTRLKSINSIESKIDYLISAMKNKENDSFSILGFIYETLGKLNNKIGRPRPSFFEKAASNWELLAITTKREEVKNLRKFRKDILFRALENYYFIETPIRLNIINVKQR